MIITRIRIGDYRIGCEIQQGTIIFYRVKHRKTYTEYFPRNGINLLSDSPVTIYDFRSVPRPLE
jgi:hypothetical protein